MRAYGLVRGIYEFYTLFGSCAFGIGVLRYSRACLVFTAEPGGGERWHWSVAILVSLLSVHCGTWGRGEVALECCDTCELA